MTIDTCIYCPDESRLPEAQRLAALTGLKLFTEPAGACTLQLAVRTAYLELFDRDIGTGIRVDFATGALAHRLKFGGGRGQALARAIGLKGGAQPDILDATAGLARDAFVLASLGCRVTLVERSPLLYALIRDGIERGLQHETTRRVLANFTAVVNSDAVEYMHHLSADLHPDVVYIDPMYPERRKSAAVKKDMQILQKLHGSMENNHQLLDTALAFARKRVVVKRPAHAETLTERQPSSRISSKKTRYDIYVNEAF